MMIIQATEAYVIKGKDDTLYDHVLPNGLSVNDYIMNLVKRGYKTWNGDGLIHSIVKELSVDEFLLVTSLVDGDVIDFKPYLKMATADLQELVPIGIPQRIKKVITDNSDPENPVVEDQVKTWEEWNERWYNDYMTRPITTIDGYAYIQSSVWPEASRAMTSTELMIAYSESYIELVSEIPKVEDVA